ncbi:MAG: TIGR04282 family arsenosugar biosynthesis glycosyltransferase [Euryarchaeota archaeon]|nr:TIGR04282 family arsenosugar biosynthesis glycosyltransferase [Euryarchaeota archaeon]
MNAIVIMAKAPIPNRVKTRLTPPLKPEEASLLYHNFLLDKLEQVKSIEAHRYVAYTPQTSESFFRSIMPPGFSLISQKGEDLGEKLSNVSNGLFAQGAEKVVMLDSDTPNLPTDPIREALSGLDEVDVVLGPCEDGGYYLIGMRSWVQELFRGIPWSTADVAKMTVKKAHALSLRVLLLERWYDVDTIIDLKRLKRDLGQPAENYFFCENTYRAISSLHI